jgi:hypothetical protein
MVMKMKITDTEKMEMMVMGTMEMRNIQNTLHIHLHLTQILLYTRNHHQKNIL